MASVGPRVVVVGIIGVSLGHACLLRDRESDRLTPSVVFVRAIGRTKRESFGRVLPIAESQNVWDHGDGELGHSRAPLFRNPTDLAPKQGSAALQAAAKCTAATMTIVGL